jgi:hypothetical protein
VPILITTAMPTSFKVELLKGLHDFTNGADVFKIALLKSAAVGSGTYGEASTNYSNITGNSDEASGAGYTAGGNTLTNITPTADGTTAITDFADTTWSSASFTTCGAMIYNTSNSNSACAILSFGGDQQVSSGDFQIQMPAVTASTAIIRVF